LNGMAIMMVRFAYGMTKPFKRGGEGGCGNAAVQGGEDSPPKWITYEDPFNTWWERHEDCGIMVRISETVEVKLKGGGFADDKKPVERDIHKLNKWLARSADYGFFHGVDVRPDKCEGQACVAGDKGLAIAAEELPDLVIPIGPESVLLPIQPTAVQVEVLDRESRAHETARGECTVQHARDMSTQEDRLMWSRQQGSGGIGTGGWGEVDALLREGSPIRSPSVGIGTTSMSELHSADCHGRESGGGALPKVGLKEKPKSRKADELGRVSRRRRQAAEPGGRLGAEEESRWLTWMADDRGREQQRDALDAGLSRGEAGAAGEDAEQRRKRRDMVVKEEEGGRLVP
jgi:hypothetical protein